MDELIRINEQLQREIRERQRAEAALKNAQEATELVNEKLLQKIYQLRETEAELRAAELKVRSLTQSAIDAIVSADCNGTIISWNRGAEQIFGYLPAEIIGQPLVVLMPVRYREAHLHGLQRYRQGEGGAHLGKILELHGLRQDGSEFPLELSLATWETHEGTFFGAIIRDISERKRAEAALAQAKETAEAANRAKSEFLANMSHELRTPLNAILGFAQLMSRSPGREPDDLENLEIIIRSGEHLLSLINDVLEMSKIEAGRAALHEDNFDLYQLLDDLEDMFGLRASEQELELRVERTAVVPRYVRTDERKLRQVLINLLSNAVKFTRAGWIAVRVSSTYPAGNEPESSAARPPAVFLHFEVEDTGPGIPPQELPHLFEAFVQTSSGQKAQEGTGLGLPISRQFVRLMGGDITVNSEGIPGRGACFRFDIRAGLAETAGYPLPLPRRVIGLAPGQPDYRVLIVEDKTVNRRLLVKMLEPLGFAVREAANGQEALDVWQSWQPHLIWMDMRMPVLDGYEATQRIRSTIGGQAPVIIALTASAFEEQRAIVLSAGCDDFVRKPFRDTDLYDKMAQHLGVRFLYEEPASNQPEPAVSYELGLGDLAGLPVSWLAEMNHAAARAQAKTMHLLLEFIRPDHPGLAETLARLIDNFEFDRIKALTGPAPGGAE